VESIRNPSSRWDSGFEIGTFPISNLKSPMVLLKLSAFKKEKNRAAAAFRRLTPQDAHSSQAPGFYRIVALVPIYKLGR